MRILHVISSIDSRSGGPSTALRGLVAAQKQAGLDVSVISSYAAHHNNDIADQLRELGVHVDLVGPGTGPLVRHPDLKKVVNDAIARNQQIVHIHALWEEIQHQAAVASRRHNVPYIFRPCGMLDPWSLSQSKWKKRLYLAWRLRRDLNGAIRLHFTSATERDLTAPLTLKPPGIVIPNGVRLDEFENLPPKSTFRARLPQIGNRRIILFLSRIHHKKGLDLLVPAFAKANLPNTVLVLIGPDDSNYMPQLKKMIDDHKVADRVFMPGMLQGADRVAALADADLFCLPSYQENFGIAVVEALAAGTPVVISDQVNIHQEITAAAVGGVVPTDADALATELHRWMTDDALRAAAGSRARDFVGEHYDWNNIARRWSAEYARLIANADRNK